MPPHPAPARRPLPYLFGNHMHWVDMQWLWGDRVLPDSVDDMLRFCAEAGARGCVNFDGVGYEKMAAEAPEALARLRAAVAEGVVEPSGCTYGQPYGLFHGGESNVRQLVFGARAVRRLLGVEPSAFWEEEFYFFPQLPQLLRAAGYASANLFFQWTWHTPELPREEAPLVLWEGADGSRIPALARTAHCLHQWPEDFDGVLEALAARPEEAPLALMQWLELLPSPDWMCRSELLLPHLRALAADPRFELRPRRQSELVNDLLEAAGADGPPVRAYRMEQVWHGMSLGKNGDWQPRQSLVAESALLAAETAAAVAGLLGRPYASWDVYPAWELEEAWRETLAAQHHDNHECEGLCGFIGNRSFARALGLAGEVLDRTLQGIGTRMAAPGTLAFNPLGWERRLGEWTVPPCGWSVAADEAPLHVAKARVLKEGRTWVAGAGGSAVFADRKNGRIRGLLRGELEIGFGVGTEAGIAPPRLRAEDGERAWVFTGAQASEGEIRLSWREQDGAAELDCVLAVDLESGGVRMDWEAEALPRLAPGFGGAMELLLPVGALRALRGDTPYAVEALRPGGPWPRKYPSGDWMTSPQWTERVEGALFASSFLDLELDGSARLLVAHDGSGQWFARPEGLACVLTLRDPWDEERWSDRFSASFLLLPHEGLSAAAAWRIAQQFRRPLEFAECGGAEPAVAAPAAFAGLRCDAPGVAVTACYREQPGWEARIAGAFGGGAVRNPFVLRLVELDGAPAEVRLTLPGPIALAARTDLHGRVMEVLRAEAAVAEPGDPPGLRREALRLSLRPREIATLMLDLEPGRHQPRHLDQHREVWARAHRTA